MEAVSENKRKRGRPRVFSEAVRALNVHLFSDVKTERGQSNVAYRQLAVNCLMDDPAFAWLCDKDKMRAGELNAWKPGILAELGRFQDEETIRAFAARICELKPKTKEAVAILRRARQQKCAPVSVLKLTRQICRVVDEYVASHPEISREQVLAAIQGAWDAADATFQK